MREKEIRYDILNQKTEFQQFFCKSLRSESGEVCDCDTRDQLQVICFGFQGTFNSGVNINT